MATKQDKTEPLTTVKPSALHPVYSVTNIQNMVRVLDGTKVTYSSWVKLFRLHCRSYKVLHHLDGKPPAEDDPTYESWVEIDSKVSQWIYGTLSDDLLVRVLDTDSTVSTVWQKIKEIFWSNKGSRAAALEQEFSNLTLSSYSSMDEYCQKLKDLSEQLRDVDVLVTDSRLVLQLVRGLPREYEIIGTYINQMSPTWDVARSMLQLEQHRQSAQKSTPTPNIVLAMPSGNRPMSQSGPSSQLSYRNDQRQNTYRGRGRGRNQNRRNNSQNNRGYGGSQTHNGSQQGYGGWNQNQQGWNPNSQPPCPHPSQQPQWAGHMQQAQGWNNSPQQWSQNATTGQNHMGMQPTQSQSANMAFQPNQVNALSPTDLGEALQAVHFNGPDQQWYMDTGASSHITSDPGPSNWTNSFSPQ